MNERRERQEGGTPRLENLSLFHEDVPEELGRRQQLVDALGMLPQLRLRAPGTDLDTLVEHRQVLVAQVLQVEQRVVHHRRLVLCMVGRYRWHEPVIGGRDGFLNPAVLPPASLRPPLRP